MLCLTGNKPFKCSYSDQSFNHIIFEQICIFGICVCSPQKIYITKVDNVQKFFLFQTWNYFNFSASKNRQFNGFCKLFRLFNLPIKIFHVINAMNLKWQISWGNPSRYWLPRLEFIEFHIPLHNLRQIFGKIFGIFLFCFTALLKVLEVHQQELLSVPGMS